MNPALHPLLSKPAPRRTPYCVDCYQNGGKVTVATRMFGDDELCDPHYLALCKDMGVEPEVITLSEAKAAKEIGQLTPIKKIRQAAKPSDPPITQSPDHPIQSFPSDSDLAEAAQNLPTKLTSQRPDSSVAPAAEGLRDRAHSPTRPAPTPSSGVPQTPSAANPQPQPRKEITMPRSETALRNDGGKRVCSCGCGAVLGSRHPYIKGHNIQAQNALLHKVASEAREAREHSGAPANRGSRKDEGDGRRDVARHVSLSKSSGLPPVAITNGNGHAAPPIRTIAHSVIASDGAYLVPCQVSEWAMDRIWLRLTPEEKAELLFRPPEAPQKEQQEPAHA